MSRAQFALAVAEIDEIDGFCTALFGIEPAKGKPGYANFAIAEPPLKLVLLGEPPAMAAPWTSSASKSPPPARSPPRRLSPPRTAWRR
jgi:hypothetical protein